MHYKNGREAKTGDPVIGRFGYPVGINCGILHSLIPGCDACNANVATPGIGMVNQACVTVGELYHAEDAFGAMEEKQPPEKAQ